MAKAANWFPRTSMLAAAEAILHTIAKYRDRIVYGGSMGGYGAIKYSALLRASAVLALCPQWSIDAAECGGQEPGWRDHFVPAMAGMGIRAEDVCGKVFVLADASEPLDAFHVERIGRACPDFHFVNVPTVGHNVTAIFAGTQNLLQLLDACAAGSTPDLVRIARRLRRHHPRRLGLLIDRAIARHPKMVFASIVRAVERREAWAVQGASYVFATADWLIARGERLRAREFVGRAAAGLDDARRQWRACAYVSSLDGSRIVLATHHGTHLAYDLRTDRCVHVRHAAGGAQHGLQLEIRGNSIRLLVDTAGGRIDLGVHRNGRLCTCPEPGEHLEVAVFEFQPAKPGWFTLRAAQTYLSAEPNGGIVCNRRSAREWEHFRLGTAGDDDPGSRHRTALDSTSLLQQG